MTKKEIRKYFISERKKLSEQDITCLTKKILNLFISKFNINGKNICCFLPIKSKNEVDTFQLLNLSSKINFQFNATKWNISNNQLIIYKINNKDDLELNSFEIPEPKSTLQKSDSECIDIVIVPLLAFDLKGNRVGYGKGVYDMFLKNFDPRKTDFIGLNFFDPIDTIDDLQPTDIKLTHCITPKSIYSFEKQS